MDFQVRRLKTKDLYSLITILGKCGKEAISKISEAVNPENKQMDNSSVGLAVISTLLLYAEEEIKPFFASIVDKTVEEFNELPFDATLVIIEELGKKEDLPNFFKRALDLMKVFSFKK